MLNKSKLVASLLIFRSSIIKSERSIMTSSSRVQKVMEDLQQNPYYEKYSNKIAQLQKTRPEEFVERIEHKQKKTEETLEKAQKRYAPVLNPKAPLTAADASSSDKKLEDIFKVELVRDKDATEIADIWQKYHVQKDVVAAMIPTDIYKKIEERIAKYPIFLFPLPRSQGYEFIMCQATGNTIHFTTLLCYQVHKENAPECLTMTHYKELMNDKGIVLMRGEFDKNVIDAKEAQCLANQFQMYYGKDDEEKLKLLDEFTNKPNNFKHMDIISQLENITLG